MKTNDELRMIFKKKFPDVSVITLSKVYQLIYLLEKELELHAKAGNLEMYMEPLNNFVANMLREKGIQYKGLELKVSSYYFRNRQAITIDKDGYPWFCGWAGGNNHEPFIKAFEEWIKE